ncbi:MAG TPA: NAD(P)H-binding protein, partial [Cellulomonas sp.]
MTNIALTGATGAVGSRVAKLLRAGGVHPRLVVRDLARVEPVAGFEAVAMGPRGYRDQTALTEALGGCDTLFLVSARESADRVVEHAHAVRAAVDAG